MDKTDLIDNVSDMTRLSKKESATAIKAILEDMSGALSMGDRIALMDFGSFEGYKRSSRMGQNPRPDRR